jgi:hypothetical protein
MRRILVLTFGAMLAAASTGCMQDRMYGGGCCQPATSPGCCTPGYGTPAYGTPTIVPGATVPGPVYMQPQTTVIPGPA